ncbi:MAG: TlpA family protein disulfide reductase [Candidatus Hydrogenedentes bacterium]|nr:TlpA family protein disulfide reductase [Candidatus Hydrogenedentota bacterium]
MKAFWKEYGSQLPIAAAGLLLVWAVMTGWFRPPHALEGKAAPAFTLDSLQGQAVHLDDELKKQVVVLDFWAIWCPPCRAALPQLAQLHREYAGRSVAFYAVNLGDDPGAVQEFLKTEGIDLPVLIDPLGGSGGLYAVEYLPQTVIIGPDGLVDSVFSGYSGGYAAELRAAIDRLLAGACLSGETA